MRAHQLRSDRVGMDTRTRNAMTDRRPAPEAGSYEIRLMGSLTPRWTTWFDGLQVSEDDDGTTVIAGPVADQAALHGLLQRIRDLGIPLISVDRIQEDHHP